MSNNKFSIFFLFLLIFSVTKGQSPYFQQRVHFFIEVELKGHMLYASETIIYTNKSGLNLDTIYFHLWPNAYRSINTAYGQEQILSKNIDYVKYQSDYSGWIDSLNFTVDNEAVEFLEYQNNSDIAYIKLNHTLKSGDSIEIKTPFKVKVPLLSSRLGYIENLFHISQWFPKPAVFDKEGWHMMPYLNQGEFYSEFGNFDVKITVPNNYTIASSGELVKQWHNKTTKTEEYTLEDAHDFAWFASPEYSVKTDSVQLPYSENWVKIQIYTYNVDESWNNAIQYAKDAIYFYSLWVGDYPYSICKVVQGDIQAGGGMEYPTITVIGDDGVGESTITLETVIMHEIGHNWFYGALGSNERDYPWMDEGLNSAFETRYIETKYPYSTENIDIPIKLFQYPIYKRDFIAYQALATRHLDQISNLNSEVYNGLNYGAIVYKKNAAIFNYIRASLGDAIFDSVIKQYYLDWKFKHPQPKDFTNYFKAFPEAYKSLEEILYTNKQVDYSIKKAKQISKNQYKIELKNNRNSLTSTILQSSFNDSITGQWYIPSFKRDTCLIINAEADAFIIDKYYKTLDLNRKNNFSKTEGILKRKKGVSVKFIGSQQKEGYHNFYFTPVGGYNENNGFMLGSAFLSNLAFPNRFEYLIMPMYAFASKNITGIGSIKYHFPFYSSLFQEVTPFINVKSFGLTPNKPFYKLESGLCLILSPYLNKNIPKTYLYLSHIIANQNFNYEKYNQFLDFKIESQNKRWYNPYNYSIELTSHKDFSLVELDVEQVLSYIKPKTGLRLQFYIAAFLYNNSNNGLFNINLSGTKNYNDYKYQETFIGRNQDYNQFWAHQMVGNQGSFAHITGYSSNRWLSALSVSSSLPFNTPFEFRLNLAAFEKSDYFFNKGIAWETVLVIHLIRDFIEIQVPLWSADGIKKSNQLYVEHNIEKVRFQIQFNQLNINKINRSIEQLF
ncbi:MAG: M1 family metallopeptidase [Bacteroidales bacterium]|nr:M1 family metallopeptidase [Bacteroidales bacterium]